MSRARSWAKAWAGIQVAPCAASACVSPRVAPARWQRQGLTLVALLEAAGGGLAWADSCAVARVRRGFSYRARGRMHLAMRSRRVGVVSWGGVGDYDGHVGRNHGRDEGKAYAGGKGAGQAHCEGGGQGAGKCGSRRSAKSKVAEKARILRGRAARKANTAQKMMGAPNTSTMQTTKMTGKVVGPPRT